MHYVKRSARTEDQQKNVTDIKDAIDQLDNLDGGGSGGGESSGSVSATTYLKKTILTGGEVREDGNTYFSNINFENMAPSGVFYIVTFFIRLDDGSPEETNRYFCVEGTEESGEIGPRYQLFYADTGGSALVWMVKRTANDELVIRGGIPPKASYFAVSIEAVPNNELEAYYSMSSRPGAEEFVIGTAKTGYLNIDDIAAVAGDVLGSSIPSVVTLAGPNPGTLSLVLSLSSVQQMPSDITWSNLKLEGSDIIQITIRAVFDDNKEYTVTMASESKTFLTTDPND